ncbi:hypothetical protein CHU92_02885 [Flavobacterium cyanobacteriorum]|uniref:Uncharacterized protein n=1 Tax=Flavobacterium cyanobacteriorum TaxID=2022802 RepID=A0A255ZQX3_9FLAO|nr:hypothetical protein [Flavobacterium cyanobacteriorum]OYQ43809.1 hypothetical protein CHU92_02885 [Flavobacterium cyanobacteriorum]
MKDNFEVIAGAFEKAGIDVATAEYSITAYSLNTDLSFKFSNRAEFLDFLGLREPDDTKKIEKIDASFTDQGIDAANFFYVNFYQPRKIIEM